MPQKHDIGHQKRNRPSTQRSEPLPNGTALANQLVAKGLASHLILETPSRFQKEQ